MQKFYKTILITDWGELYEQKLELEEMLKDDLNRNLWGIVKLCDDLLEAAVECGFWTRPSII